MPNWLTVPELIKIGILLIAVVSWGFSLENRVSLAEQAMHQETLGYRFMQDRMAKRLETLDERIDRRLTRIEEKLDRAIP